MKFAIYLVYEVNDVVSTVKIMNYLDQTGYRIESVDRMLSGKYCVGAKKEIEHDSIEDLTYQLMPTIPKISNLKMIRIRREEP